MLLLLAGAAVGASGAWSWFDNKRRQRTEQVDSAVADTSEPGPSAVDGAEPSTSGSAIPTSRRRLPHLAVVAALAALAVACGATVLVRRRDETGYRSGRGGGPPRIPLRELVRFREEQWFLEELENSREGDPNAMLRLAKMYLYGQGCERNVNIAQEWLRRARAGGVYCTLDELLTAEDLESFRRANAAQRQQQGRQPQQPGKRARGRHHYE